MYGQFPTKRYLSLDNGRFCTDVDTEPSIYNNFIMGRCLKRCLLFFTILTVVLLIAKYRLPGTTQVTV